MKTGKITPTEKAVLLIVLLSLVNGYILYFSDMQLFLEFTVEDGIVEWLTVLGLLMGSITLLRRAFRTGLNKGWQFFFTTTISGLFLFLAAGEEVSWGQRIFGIESSGYFLTNNTQKEMNLHNLVVNGVSINKLVFSAMLSIGLIGYLAVLPLFYRRNPWIRHLVSNWGIPLPKPYQIIAFIFVVTLSELLLHEKKAEFLENGTAFILFLITAFPYNKEDFLASPVKGKQLAGHYM